MALLSLPPATTATLCRYSLCSTVAESVSPGIDVEMPNGKKVSAPIPTVDTGASDQDAPCKVGEQYMVRRADNTWREYGRNSKRSTDYRCVRIRLLAAAGLHAENPSEFQGCS